MIQDIAPHQYNVAYQNKNAKESDVLLVYRQNALLCYKTDTDIFFPTVAEIRQHCAEALEDIRYLFSIDEINFFTLSEHDVLAFGNWGYLPKEQIRAVRPMWKAFAAITGYQIDEWYQKNIFCGRCGNKLQHSETERAMVCPQCGNMIYPQICPSVIVAITSGDYILLTKYASTHSAYKKYALVAGYTEIGESVEDTVRREVMEEVGLKVKNIRYYKSQPWSFSGTILMGFFCEVDGSREISMDAEELSVAEWFHRNKMPKNRSEADVSLTGEMMKAFEDGLV